MADNTLSNLSSFLFSGQPPPQVTTYGSTTQGIPDWLAQGSINLLNTSAGVAQGLSQNGYPLAGLPQIGGFNPNYGAAQSLTNTATNSWQPYVNSAGATDQWAQNNAAGAGTGAAQPYYDSAQGGYGAGLNANSLGLVNPYAQNASGMSSIGAASPYINTGAGYASAAAGINPLAGASSLINQARAPLSSTVNDLMDNSYIPQVADTLGQLSQRNLEKYLLPQTDSQFIKAGQAGSSRNADYDALTRSYASQDLNAQIAQTLQSGYQSAQQAATQQQGTLASLAGTVGNLGAAQQQGLLGAAGAYNQAGNTTGGLTTAQQQALINSGSLVGSTSASDIAQKLSAASGLSGMGTAAGTLANSGIQNALQAANQTAGLGQQSLTSNLAGGQALDALGQEQQNYDTSAVQANNQNILNTANWTPSQLSWLSNILHGLPSQGVTQNTTNQGPSSVYSPSGASQLTGLSILGKYV